MRRPVFPGLSSAVCLSAALLFLAPARADAIPVFARRYRVSCQLCHNVIPQLTGFGQRFMANGYRMSALEPPRDTIGTGDPLLTLMDGLPLAVRLDAYAQLYADGKAVTDFQAPYQLKVLSSGALSQTFSYYFYAFLAERGEVGGVEDAFLFVNDIGGEPIDLQIGQFQASDPLFKRELRLEFEDYAVYRARVGDVPADLTYDRGVMASAEFDGFTVTGEVLNGNGKGAALPDRHFDNDPAKNLMLHLTRDLAPGVRLGAFGYYGRITSAGLLNETSMFGLDGTLERGAFTLNLQYLHREDDRPNFLPVETRNTVDGGFGELLVRPAGSRWYGFALYNLVDSDRPILDVRLGGPAGITRYQSVGGGFGHLIRRNLRWMTEATWDIEAETLRWTLGFVSAF